MLTIASPEQAGNSIYSRALGDFESLPAGAISEGIVWCLKRPLDFNLRR
jgi:hypothetical protein